MAKTKIIVAHDKNRGIGYKNAIPWFIPGELKWVATVTKKTSDPQAKNALIMGRRTWESIPINYRPLSERLNVVVSQSLQPGVHSSNFWVFENLEGAIAQLNQTTNIESIFIFGGATIYRQSLDKNLVDEVLTTEVPGEYLSDTYFPCLPNTFSLTSSEQTAYGSIVVTRNTYAYQPELS